MKRPMRKLIAFSAALASLLSCNVSNVTAAYVAEPIAECEYDELIQMRDKSILIDNGNDYNVTDDTQLIVIDENGQKSLIDKNLGINGIYNYVSTTMGLYNYISPTCMPYSFDYFDAAYRISTEQNAVIVGIGDNFALMDNSGNIISEQYNNIYRINDDYFIIDESTDNTYSYDSASGFDSNKSGLMKADGTVIVQPTDGVIGYYLCVDEEHFLVHTESGDYFIDNSGNIVTEKYSSINEQEHYDKCYEADKQCDYQHFYASKYAMNYLLNDDMFKVSTGDGYSDTALMNYDYQFITDFIYNDYDIYELDGIGYELYDGSYYSIIDCDGKVLINGADSIYSGYDYDDDTYKVIYVEIGDTTYTYDTSMNLISEEKTKSSTTYPFDYGYITIDGTDVTISNNDYSKSTPLVITPYSENAVITNVEKWNWDYNVSGSDITLKITETVTVADDSGDWTYENDFYRSYLINNNFNVLDVSNYACVAKAQGDMAMVQAENAVYQVVDYSGNVILNLPEGFNQYMPDVDSILNEDGESNDVLIGYIFSSDTNFSYYDTELNPICENVIGEYIGNNYFYIPSTDADGNTTFKYGFFSKTNGILTEAVYDCIKELGSDKYAAVINSETQILDAELNVIRSWSGAYSWSSGTKCSYQTMNKRENGITTSIVYNPETDEILYKQEGIYDNVSDFFEDYAVVTNYDESSDSDDNLWTDSSSDANSYGVINLSGIEYVIPSQGIELALLPSNLQVDNTDEKIKLRMYVNNNYGYTSVDSYGDVTDYTLQDTRYEMPIESLSPDIAKNGGYTLAYINDANNYMTLKNGEWGMVASDGTVLIEPQFYSFDDFDGGIAKVIRGSNDTYTEIIKDSYNSNYNTHINKIIYSGVIDIYGNIVVEPFNNIPTSKVIERSENNINFVYYIYEDPVYQKDNVFHVQKIRDDGSMDFTDYVGSDVINDFALTYGYQIARKEGDLYYVEKDGLAGIVTPSNEEVIPVTYRDILSFEATANTRYVRPQVEEILESEFVSKLKETADGDYLVNVRDSNNKVGVYKISGTPEETTTTTTSTTTSGTTTTTTTITDTYEELGDINSDNSIDARDASLALTEYAISSTSGESSFTDKQKTAADVNKDNTVDARDASIVLSFYAYKATDGKDSFDTFIKNL